MIFKTFDNDIDKWTAKIGIFGKSFNDLGKSIKEFGTAVNNAFESAINNIDNFDENVGFWESLKNNLFSQKDANKDWIKNSLGQIISKENIDSYIEQLDLDTAKEKISDIFNHEKLVNQNKKSWQDYFNTLDDGEGYIVDLIKDTNDLSKLTGEDLVKANQQARASALAHNEAIKAQTFSAKAGTVALKALSIAGNMIAMWAISKAISFVAEKIDDVAHSAEHCKERVDELMSSYQSALDKANSNAKSIENLASRYEELLKGVNNLGQNVSLATDEYNEYNDTVNQIADMFPTMVQGYTSEGNAILSLKGNVEQLRDAYKEAQQEAYNMLIVSGEDSDGNDIITNYQNQVNGNESFLSKTSSYIDGEAGAKDAIDVITQLTGALTPEEFREAYNQLYKEYENVWHSDKMQDALKSSGFQELKLKWTDITDEDLANVRSSAQATIQTYQAEINSALKNVQTLANAYLMTNEDYAKLDDQSKNAASIIVNSINENIASGFDNKINVGEYVNKVVGLIKDNPEVQDALVGLFSLDIGNMPVNEAKSLIDTYIGYIASEIGEDPLELKIRLGFDDVVDIAKRLQNSIRQITDDHGITDREEYAYLMNEIDFQSFTQAQAELWLEVTLGAQNAREAVKMYKDAIAEAAEAPTPTLSISQTIDQLNTQLKPAFDSLKSAYQDIFADDGYNPNAVDIPMLDSIKSSIEEINKLEDVDITIDMDAFDTLATTLTDVNTEKDDAIQAFNDFATSIFYATNATDGMTDETKELVEQLLESLGIVNATEVAEYALAEAKTQAVLATHDLAMVSAEDADAKVNEFRAILAEGEAAGLTRQQIYNLTAAELAFGNNTLNTEQKIGQLRNLAKAYGDTASAALATAIANDLASGHTDTDTAINDLMAQINAGVQKVDIDFSPIEKSAAKAGKSAAEAYMDALKDKLSDLNNVINYIGDTIGDQIDLFNDQKDAAVEALEAEKNAAEEALKSEKELVQEKIDAKQAEIDAIKDARIERENEFNLQKAQYEWQRMLNQRTILQFSEGKGMHYVIDTKEAREAREKVTEAKENIQIANIEKDISGLNDTIDDLDKKIEESNKYYDTLIEQTEKYWDSLIKGLEDYKSRWQELTDIEEQAKMELMLRNLGIATDDIVNMSESAFGSFKGTYLGLLNEMYAGNDEMIGMLQKFGGISADALVPFSGTIESVADSLDNFAGQTSNTVAAVQTVSDALNNVPDVDISNSIKQFDALGNAIDNATASISGKEKADRSSGSSGNNTPKTQSNSSNASRGLIDSIENIGETTAETLGESGGDGTIGKFDELGDTIANAEGHVTGVIDGMDDLDGMSAECTIKVNIETNGSVPEYASGTGIDGAIDSMNLNSSEHTTKHKGKAFAEGTGKYKGLPKAEKNALVSEYGQTEMTVLPNGDTIITDEPTMMDLPKDTVIYNEEQTKKIMDNKVDVSGKAHAGGTDDGINSEPIPYDPDKDDSDFAKFYKAWNAYYGNINKNVEDIQKNLSHHLVMEHNQQMQEEVNRSVNNSSVVNNKNVQPNINVGGITITCPGVTDQEVVRKIHSEVNQLFNGFHNLADQYSRT